MVGAKCPFCHGLLSERTVVKCSGCGIFHHRECWSENGGKCTIFGCNSSSSTRTQIGVETDNVPISISSPLPFPAIRLSPTISLFCKIITFIRTIVATGLHIGIVLILFRFFVALTGHLVCDIDWITPNSLPDWDNGGFWFSEILSMLFIAIGVYFYCYYSDRFADPEGFANDPHGLRELKSIGLGIVIPIGAAIAGFLYIFIGWIITAIVNFITTFVLFPLIENLIMSIFGLVLVHLPIEGGSLAGWGLLGFVTGIIIRSYPALYDLLGWLYWERIRGWWTFLWISVILAIAIITRSTGVVERLLQP